MGIWFGVSGWRVTLGIGVPMWGDVGECNFGLGFVCLLLEVGGGGGALAKQEKETEKAEREKDRRGTKGRGKEEKEGQREGRRKQDKGSKKGDKEKTCQRLPRPKVSNLGSVAPKGCLLQRGFEFRVCCSQGLPSSEACFCEGGAFKLLERGTRRFWENAFRLPGFA